MPRVSLETKSRKATLEPIREHPFAAS